MASSVVPIREREEGERSERGSLDDIPHSAPQSGISADGDYTPIGRIIAGHRDWRIETSDPEKSVVFLSGPRAGGQLSPVSGDSDRGAPFMNAFFALSAAIEGWRRKHLLESRVDGNSNKVEPSSFAVVVQGVRCRVQRVQETRFHVRVPSSLLPLTRLGMPESLKTFLLSRELDSGGLIIVCGGYGSGKTNTVNAVVRERVDRCGGYALMLGAPIEYEFAGFHGNNGAPGFVEQVDLVGLDIAAEIRASMRNFPSGATSILGYPEVISHEGVGEMLRAANRGNLVFADMHAKDLEASLFNIVSMAHQDKELLGRELLGNSLRMVIHQKMSLMPDASRGVHVAFNAVKISRALKAAISDVSMPLSKVVTTLLSEMKTGGSPS